MAGRPPAKNGIFGSVFAVVDVTLEQGVGALGDLLQRTREALAEVDETHTARRHGRKALVFDPALAFVAEQDWDGLKTFLAALEPAELKRLKHAVVERHEDVKAAGGASASLALTRLIDAELKRRPSPIARTRRAIGPGK